MIKYLKTLFGYVEQEVEKKVDSVVSSLTVIVTDLGEIAKTKTNKMEEYVKQISDINKLHEEANLEKKRAEAIAEKIASLLKV